MHVGLTLRVSDEQTRIRLEKYMPEVRSRILMVLSSQSVSYTHLDVYKRQDEARAPHDTRTCGRCRTCLCSPLAGLPRLGRYTAIDEISL